MLEAKNSSSHEDGKVIEELIAENRTLSGQLQEIEKPRKSQSAELDELNEVVAGLEKETAIAKDEFQRAMAKIKDQKQKIKDMESERSSYLEALGDGQQALLKVTNYFSDLHKKYIDQSEKIYTLERSAERGQRVSSLETELQETKKTLAERDASLAQALASLEEVNLGIESLTSEARTLQNQRDSDHSTLQASRDEISGLKNALEDSRKLLIEKETELVKVLKLKDELSEDVKQLMFEKNTIQMENDTRAKREEAGRTERSKLMDEI